MKTKGRKDITPQEIERIREGCANGESIDAIALAIGRSCNGVWRVIYRLGIKREKAVRRPQTTLSPEEIHHINRLRASGHRYAAIANMTGRSRYLVVRAIDPTLQAQFSAGDATTRLSRVPEHLRPKIASILAWDHDDMSILDLAPPYSFSDDLAGRYPQHEVAAALESIGYAPSAAEARAQTQHCTRSGNPSDSIADTRLQSKLTDRREVRRPTEFNQFPDGTAEMIAEGFRRFMRNRA